MNQIVFLKLTVGNKAKRRDDRLAETKRERNATKESDFISAVDPCQPGLIHRFHRVTQLCRDLQQAALIS